MALIEGIGDEVTLLCTLLVVLSVIVLAWISTHTSDRGPTQWPAQGHRRQNPSARDGAEQELRQPESGGSDPVPEGTTTPITQNDLNSSASPDTAPVVGDPSLGDDLTCSDHQLPSSSDPPSSPAVRHRGPATQGRDTITLRLKFLNETERVVTVGLHDSVLHIKRSQFPGQEPRVRLIYQGQLLRNDSQTVASLQLTDGCVLHCHLSQHATASGSGGAEPSLDPVNIGSLMVPFFVLLLGILWYCQFQYPHVFNATATSFLAAMTLFVLVLVLFSYRR
ncbi:transmembrane and ubiquitin-like domain-containing protein 1 [Bufo bufo]|uniref:transmembrane and ubiquitin-like domain-containing protein 1 n=1 Tax=Bufo bufo TaxID=8384 RepID=UPI001ABDC712|nr:transmembrane and ubiquitin-like domain-containing protein 1 [Bufo bufo]XP_040269270.1 transmembrane and ubiquitin-like domain-containing protein 1 [Bufo bufo]